MNVEAPAVWGDTWNTARVIASHDLVGDSEVISTAETNWPRLLTLLSQQRLCGLALSAVDARVFKLAGKQYDELLDQHEMQLALDLQIERLVLACFGQLENLGIDARLLKGPATSHRFYADPALRSFGDADILVRRADFRAAIDAITRIGLSRRREPPRAWFDRYVKAACLVRHDGLEVDVHQMLTPGPYGIIIEPDTLFRTPADRVLIGRRSVACLDPVMAFVHACVHAALGDPSPRFVSLRDVVTILQLGLDATELRQLVSEWQLEPVVARALSLAESVLGIRVEHSVIEGYRSYQPSRRDQWRLSSYDSGASRFDRQSAATFWELRSFRDRAEYAVALALPARTYLRARDSTYSERLRRSMSLARSWRPK